MSGLSNPIQGSPSGPDIIHTYTKRQCPCTLRVVIIILPTPPRGCGGIHASRRITSLIPGMSQVQEANAHCADHNMPDVAVLQFQTHAMAPAEAGSCPCCGGGGGASNLVLSAIILCIPIPTPSMTANSTAHPIAEFLAALNPPRTASDPPVKKPAMIALYLLRVISTTFTREL